MMTRDDYHVEAGHRRCAECGRDFKPDEEYVSGLVEVEPSDEHPHGLKRCDFCPDHWPQDDTTWLAFWRTRVPVPEEPKRRRLVIDDGRMLELFFHLAETDDPARLDLRYVIGLILIRKRRLKLDGTRRRGERSVMLVRKARSKQVHELEDRELTEEAIRRVSEDIGSLMDLPDEDAATGETDDQP